MKKLLILLFSILILFCSNITLGAGYTSYATSRDGKEVCAGGDVWWWDD